jgi:hypothetical protein
MLVFVPHLTLIFNSVIRNMQDCILVELLDAEDPPRSSRDSKNKNVSDIDKDSSLMFKITHKIAYKNVLKGTYTYVLQQINLLFPFGTLCSLFINHCGSSQCCCTES